MRRLPVVLSIVAIAAIAALPYAALAQDAKPKAPAKDAAAPPDFAPPQPTPHHLHLAKEAGTWDATVESFEAPGKPPVVTKGSEVSRMARGGLWLITEFQGSFADMPFEGHGITGYDPSKQKYVGIWTDSMTPTALNFEGTCDPSGKIRTTEGQGIGMNGGTTTYRMVTEQKDADTKIFSLSAPGPDGKDTQVLKITYKRRK